MWNTTTWNWKRGELLEDAAAAGPPGTGAKPHSSPVCSFALL